MPPLRPIQLPAARTEAKPKSKPSGRLRIVGWSAGAILLLGCAGGGVAYALGYFDPPPAVVAVSQELLTKLDDHAKKGESADNNERFALFKDIAEKARSLPAAWRKPLEEQGRKMIEQHLKSVLEMPPEEQNAALDKDLDLIQMMIKEGEKQRAARDAARAASAKADGAADGKSSGAVASSGPAGPSGSGGPAGAGMGPPATDAERAARHNQMLATVPADVRAEWRLYNQLLQARAVQRGMSLPNFGARQ